MQPTLGFNFKKYLFEQMSDDLIANIESEIFQSFQFWLPFVEIVDLSVQMGDDSDIGKNTINISLTFTINKSQNYFDTINVTIGE